MAKVDTSNAHIAAAQFVERWRDRLGGEKELTYPFWLDLLTNVYGITDPPRFIRPHYPVKSGEMDVYLPSAQTIIEMKARGKDLDKKNHKGETAYEQALRYVNDIEGVNCDAKWQRVEWIITSNFDEFRIYKRKDDELFPEFKQLPRVITLESLPDTWQTLNFIVSEEHSRSAKEEKLSREAAGKMDQLYLALEDSYLDPDTKKTKEDLAILLTRLVFCMYAEDSSLFEPKLFTNYISSYKAPQVRNALIELFQVLNQPTDARNPYLQSPLKDFPYVNGGLFEREIEIPNFTDDMHLKLIKAAREFNWREISPVIFGNLFEGVLNPEIRREGGMVYTSPENIHKLTDALFFDELREEHANARGSIVALKQLQEKLSSLIFFDPACGSGNFLTETYLELRELENEIIAELVQLSPETAHERTAMVSTEQFYGLEINEFAVAVAHAALWIAKHQTNLITERTVGKPISILPLSNVEQILCRNALRFDWSDLVEPSKCTYIIGNPPFKGGRTMTPRQKEDMHIACGDIKKLGDLDYVGAWYFKAAQYMQDTNVRAAFVSTNSITQGEQVAILWKPLFEEFGIGIDFAYRTFKWGNDSKNEAQVHVVIVGFSQTAKNNTDKWIVDESGLRKDVNNINPYLVDAPNVFIYSRSTPISDVPQMGIGNKPICGGNYLFSKEEKEEFVKLEPQSEKWFRPWLGAKEFINGIHKYCLWLGDCSPAELRKMPKAMQRVEAVRQSRLASKCPGTRRIADTPRRFHVENMPETNYIVVPEASSERRKYVPIGFMSPNVLSSNLVRVIPEATLYHFGVLTSSVHNSWMRIVAGRLKSDYRYSANIVYNNFIWIETTEAQKAQIEKLAQVVLDARELYPDSSLADLYDPLAMPPELIKAHQALDRAVLKLYGLAANSSEEEIVLHLMKLYEALSKSK